jgi:hypothetical protein
MKKNKLNIMQYSIYFEPQKEAELLEEAEFLNTENAELITNDPMWPGGYKVFEQDINGAEFETLDELANEHVCIDLKPSPRPPYGPVAR